MKDYSFLNNNIENKVLTHLKDMLPAVNTAELKLNENAYWRTGTRSIIQRYSTLNEKSYIVKIVPLSHSDDALTEKAVNTVFSRHEDTKNICAKLLGYKIVYDLKSHLFVFAPEFVYTLNKKLEDKIVTPSNLGNLVIPSTDPVNSMNNNGLKYLKEIEEELIKLSGGKITSLDKLDSKQYTKNFMRYTDQKKTLSKKNRKILKDAFKTLADDYLCKKEFDATIQHDGYPWHNSIDHLIDLGDTKIGSRLLHLGCLYLHPSVFNRFGEKECEKEEIVNEIAGYCYNQSPQEIKNLGLEYYKEGIYVGGIYGNIRLTYGDFFKEWDKIVLRNAALEQLNILGKSRPEAKKIKPILERLWKQ